MRLEIENIRKDGGTQPRSKLHCETTEQYAEQMRVGDEFPPVTVFFDGNDYWLSDGFHRMEAWRQVKPGEAIEAEIIQGTRSEAQWYSFGVNKSHGLQRTLDDRIRAIKAALHHPEGAKRSDRDIARHVGVSPSTVGKYREEMGVTVQIGQSSREAAEAGGQPSPEPKAAENKPDPQPAELPTTQTKTSRPRKGRDGRTINTAKIGGSPRRIFPKPRSAAEYYAAKQEGYQGSFSSTVKLAIPNNHVKNCAYDLLRNFTFEYLQKVFDEVVNMHQQQTQKEAS